MDSQQQPQHVSEGGGGGLTAASLAIVYIRQLR